MKAKTFTGGIWFFIVDKERKRGLFFVVLDMQEKVFANLLTKKTLTEEEAFDEKVALEPLILKASGEEKKTLAKVYTKLWKLGGLNVKCEFFQISSEDEKTIKRNLENHPKYKKFSTYKIELFSDTYY